MKKDKKTLNSTNISRRTFVNYGSAGVAGLIIRPFPGLIENDAEQRSAMNSKLEESSASVYLPRTKKDSVWFIVLSISAGICEELLFRGYLIWYMGE